MSDLTDTAEKKFEEGVEKPQESEVPSVTNLETKDDDWVSVDAKYAIPDASTTVDDDNVEVIPEVNAVAKVQATEGTEERDELGETPGEDGGTADVQRENGTPKDSIMEDVNVEVVPEVNAPEGTEERDGARDTPGEDGGTAEVQQENGTPEDNIMEDVNVEVVPEVNAPEGTEERDGARETPGEDGGTAEVQQENGTPEDSIMEDVNVEVVPEVNALEGTEERDGARDTPGKYGGTAEVQQENGVEGVTGNEGGDGEKRVEEDRMIVEEGEQVDEITIPIEVGDVEKEEKKRAEDETTGEEEKMIEERKEVKEHRQREEERKRAEEERMKLEEMQREEEKKAEEKQKEEEKKSVEEEKQKEDERKTAEEEKQKEEERKKAEEEKEEERKRVEEEKQKEEKRKRVEEEKQKEEERKRAEEEKQKEEQTKRAEEEKQKEEERKRVEQEKHSEESQREELSNVEELQVEGQGTDETDQTVGKETIATPVASEVSEGTELTRRKVANKDDPSELKTEQADSTDRVPPSDGSMSTTSILFLISISVVILVAVIKFMNAPDMPEDPSIPSPDCKMRKRSERAEVLLKEMESLRKKYPTLDQSSLDTVAGASWSHVQEQQELIRPVVLLLISQPGHIKANDVAKRVASMYDNVYYETRSELVRVDGAHFQDGFADEVKKDIDTRIKAGLEGCARVVVINDIDKIKPCSTILFHGYCDNDGAPYKDAVFVFTMTLENAIPKGTSKLDTEEIVQDHLEEIWRQCPEEFSQDKVVAMNSRIANNIVMLN